MTDHDSKVLARRTFRCKAWDLGSALDWAADRASRAGFAGVTVACEPTGHRWMVLAQLATERGMAFVCVQPALSSWVRKTEDLTTDKTDEKDAVLIARLTAQLRCYLPEPVDESHAAWARLRHLGARREELIAEHVAAVQTIRDLLECVWPAVLETAKHPFRSATWVAALAVVMGRGLGHDAGDLDRTRRLGLARFERAVHVEVLRRGGVRPCLRVVRSLFAALTDGAGVLAHRPAVFERLELTLTDWDDSRSKLTDIEARMVDVLDEPDLTALVTSIDGLSPVGAAAILAQTGDLTRFTSARAVVKHAGLAPRERKSGTFTGRARVIGAGRPQLRVAAWWAVWGCLQTNRVYAARYRHLTSRENNRLTPTQAQTAVAAAILRQLYAVVVQQRAWDPVIAGHGTTRWKETPSTTAA
ncbi:IS110 family transposase [Terrabacter carboxydivorans]|uniref:IS110 family transposase n=1 Tax=Terrabacter carboxydivorans TaxID=619730 RepID=UPI0031E30734